MKRFDDDCSKHVLKPFSLDKKAVSGAVTPIAVKTFKGQMMKGYTCGLQWRLSASLRSPDQAFSTNPGERLKSNHIETSDGTSRINSAPRLLRVQHYRLDLSRSECVRFLLVESQLASCSGNKQKL